MVLDFTKENVEMNGRQGWIDAYLVFKKDCVDRKIIDIKEIIKLFDVWLSHVI